ncbi:hypothetical protein [Dactylosporangium sp. CA-233914]|uniref:hypothetical protein n=1 Tax=Dactylosporangium sp. CA-233914 TaxID=3239934 RepID=UPI003D936301
MGRRTLSATLAALACVAIASCTTGPGRVEPASSGVESAAWRRLPDGPLTAREGAIALWTGTEVLVVGGSAAPPCPPTASCVPPDRLLTDGAAYSPASRTWRAIAPAPEPVAWADAVVVGQVAYVLPSAPRGGTSSLLAYDIGEDRWSRLSPPGEGGDGYRLLGAGEHLVAYRSSDERDPDLPDLFHDPRTAGWQPLPADPLGPGFDRTMAWTGRELVLFDKQLVPDPGAQRPSVTRAALVVDPFAGAPPVWRRLADSEILGTSPWLVAGGRLVNPTLGGADGGKVGNYGRAYPYGGVVDLPSGRWSTLPPAPDGLESAGAFDERAAVYTRPDGAVLDVARGRWIHLPQLPKGSDTAGPTVVAAGRDLVIFGGAHWTSDQGTLRDEGWIWSPR